MSTQEMRDDRRQTLLQAAYDLLKKCDDPHYVLSPLEQEIYYDNADCDGGCLMNDIAAELGIEE